MLNPELPPGQKTDVGDDADGRRDQGRPKTVGSSSLRAATMIVERVAG